MIRKEDLIYIGKCLKPHGIKGEISAILDIDNIDKLSCIVFNVDGIYVPFFIENIRTRNKESILLKIDGVNSEFEVNEFSNQEIYALSHEYTIDSIIDDEMMYAEDFIGYEVFENDKHLGVIVDYDDSTDNSLFILKQDNNEELLVPIVDDFIKDVDIEQKILIMDLPIGLCDL